MTRPLTPQELARIASDYGVEDKPKSTYRVLTTARPHCRPWGVSEHSTYNNVEGV